HVEFTKQIDGYRLSSYYSKDRNGKLKPEPVWDWNLSFGNANYLQGGKTNGWYWNLENVDEGIPSSKHIWLRRLIYGLPAITTTAPWTEANGPGDPDFRQKITDRWAVLRTNVLNGARVNARIDEIAALLAQPAARNYSRYSGLLDSYTWPNPVGPPYDVDYTQPTYAAIISEMKKWVSGHSSWMDNQFLASPSLSRKSAQISSSFMLTISTPLGAIYYTTDGTDPRLPGGGISPRATLYSGPIMVSSNAGIVARAYVNPTMLWTPWSAPVNASFVSTTPKLVITEIMYHPVPPPPGGTNSDEDFEYIELKNVGATALNVSSFTLSGGVEFTFPNRTVAAGERILVVKSRYAFTNRYGVALNAAIVGEYGGNLANNGNRLLLRGPVNETILDFTYSDNWYPLTDGFGFSLIVVDENAPVSAWGSRLQWRPSNLFNGAPGQEKGSTPAYARVVINEALTHSDPPPPLDTIELRNFESTNVNIGGWFLTDDFNEPKKFRIPPGTIIPAQGYLTFDEAAFNAGTGGNVAFSLSSQGDEIYLFSADSEANLTGYFNGFEFGPARNGVTFGRHLLSTGEERFVPQAAATLSAANSPLLVGPVVISEIMYRPSDVFTNGAFWNNTENEYIELRNISTSTVTLYDPARPANTWKLDDAVQFAFPPNTTLAAGAFALVVNFNPATEPDQLAAFRAEFSVGAGIPIFGPYTPSLDNADGNVTLAMPDTPELDGVVPYVVVDQVHYRDQAPWPLSPDGLGHALHR
ncbi:MAG TPA: lamin tail domain-containing protein, partial [Verrucomicrobiae bacterium]|nr:lamin tail domain-containing protein [Verrucomicrobiae bacterium]